MIAPPKCSRVFLLREGSLFPGRLLLHPLDVLLKDLESFQVALVAMLLKIHGHVTLIHGGRLGFATLIPGFGHPLIQGFPHLDKG